MKICVQWMIRFSYLLLFCIQGFPIESEPNQEKLSIETFEAVAYSTEDKILYRELHRIQHKNQRIIHSETVYLNPEGEKIAEMISDYSNNIHVPNYRFRDDLQDYEDGVECHQKECVMCRHLNRCFRNSETVPDDSGGFLQILKRYCRNFLTFCAWVQN